MRIPVYEPQVGEAGAAPLAVTGPASPPPAAFGTGIAAQTENTGRVVEGIGNELADHMVERNRLAAQTQVIDADTNFRKDLEDVMFSTERDPEKNNMPKGVFSRQLSQAAGATQDFDQSYAGLRQKYLSQFGSNPYQQAEMSKLMDDIYATHRQLVIRHEATQERENQKTILDGNLKQMVDDAGRLADPKDFLSQLQLGHDRQYSSMKSNGYDDGSILAANDKFTTDMAKSAIMPLISPNPTQALKFLDSIKDKLTPDNVANLRQFIDTESRHADELQQYQKKQSERGQFDAWNQNEGTLSGKLANGQLTMDDLDANKGQVSDSFYKMATVALKNVGVSDGTDSAKENKAIELMSEFGRIADAEGDQRTKALMKYRTDVLANSTKLDPDVFGKLMSYSDPHFIATQVRPKSGWLQAGMDFIKDHYQKYSNGGNVAAALSNFINGATHPDVKPEDIPAVAQTAIKPDVYKENPSLVGKPDLSNNIVNQGGIKQVTGATTTLKPDQRINLPKTFKAGDEQSKNGITYVRGEDGKWRPKN